MPERNVTPVRLAVLIPCFNEEATIGAVVSEFHAVLPGAEIHVFDNSSTDATVLRALEAGAHVSREPRQGKGHVIQSMFRSIDADLYLLVDGDQTYPADATQSLLDPIVRGQAQMVIGSRLHPSARSEFGRVRWCGRIFSVRLSRTLTEDTGGQLLDVDSEQEMAAAFRKIVADFKMR